MAFNGSGVFVRLYNWVNDAAANIRIRADRMDNEMNGFATGLSTCITKDGQTTITANLPMASFRHTGVGDATARSHYSSFAQVQDGKSAWVDGGGTADAITASYSIPITALVDGQMCFVRATAANATTTPTFAPNGLTARTIVKNGGSALVAGDIAGDGHELILRYDLANTRWELMNPKVIISTIPYTAASASGAASLDFAEDTDNGTNKVTLAAPAALASDRAVTFPDAAGEITVLGNTTTGTGSTLVKSAAPSMSSITLAAGTATAGTAPKYLTSGTNLTVAVAGATEYDGIKQMFTPIGTQRGIVPSYQEYLLNSTFAGGTGTSAQPFLNVGATVSGSTIYEFVADLYISKSAGVTTHTTGILWGGTATLNWIGYSLDASWSAGGSFRTGLTGTFSPFVEIATSFIPFATDATAVQHRLFKVRGFVSINAGGTFIPQYILSANPGGAYTTAIGSYMKIWPVGASGANVNVGTWA